MGTEVYKLTGTEVVIVLWPPGGGDSMVRVDGSWMTVKDWGGVTVGELRDDFEPVRDEKEVSRLVKEVISASTDKPADHATS